MLRQQIKSNQFTKDIYTKENNFTKKNAFTPKEYILQKQIIKHQGKLFYKENDVTPRKHISLDLLIQIDNFNRIQTPSMRLIHI